MNEPRQKNAQAFPPHGDSVRHRLPWRPQIAIVLVGLVVGAGLRAAEPRTPPGARSLEPSWATAPSEAREASAEGGAPSAAAADSTPEVAGSAAGSSGADAILVRGFLVSGNSVVSTEEIEAVLAPYVGERCDLQKLREAAARVSDLYRSRGYGLARAYLPAQEIRDGRVRIALLEGAVGEVHIDGNTNYSADFIRGFLAEAFEGPAINLDELERSVLLLNTEFPDLAVSTRLERGEKPGTVDLRTEVEDELPLRASLSYNNFGTEQTSRHRFGAHVDWTNAVIPGALLSADGLIGLRPDDLAFGSGAYTVPVNRLGTKVGAHGSYGTYDVGQELSDLGISGELASGGLFASHAFVKTRAFSLSAELGYEMKHVRYFVLDQESARDKIRYAYLGARAELVHWSGKSYAQLNLTQGLGGFLDGTESNNPGSSRVGADNSFTRLNLLVARFQPLNDTFSIYARVMGQWASDTLFVSEQWTLGGADTVRGYGQGEILGDDGYFVSVEGRVAPLENKEILQFAAFVDHGGIFVKRPLPGQRSDTFLTGAGIGVRSHLEYVVEADVRLDLGWPIEPHENSLGEGPVIYASATLRY